jgi:TolB protein
LSWEGVDAEDLAGYSVYRGTEPDVDVSGDPVKNGHSETSYTDEGVENGTTYHYVVTAVDTAGNGSEASNEVKRTPFSSPPEQP